MNKLELYIQTMNSIKKLFELQEFELARERIDQLPKDSEGYHISLSIYYFSTSQFDKCYNLLINSHEKFPNSFDVYFNLALISEKVKRYKESSLYFAKAIKLSKDDNDRKEATTQLKNLMEKIGVENLELAKELNEIAKKELSEGDNRWYPIDSFGNSLIRKTILDSDENLYLSNLYKVMDEIIDINITSSYLVKTELLKGQVVKKNKLILDNKSIVPISFIDNMTNITIKTPSKKLSFPKGTLNFNQYNYLMLDEVGVYQIESSEDIFIGDPWPLKEELKSTPLIINIFIDGLSNSILSKNLKKVMPNTYDFFKNGYISANTFSTGEWTYPSMSSILTGKTSMSHGRFHGKNKINFAKFNDIYFKDFQNNGYKVTHITGNWRMTPTFDYLNGTDRTIYQNAIGGFKVAEMIPELIEQIETFKNTNQFYWLGVMDLHDVPDQIDKNLYSQSLNPAENRQEFIKSKSSVLSKYDENKIIRYEKEIKRLDFHLAMLYRYLKENYSESEYLVSILSDHGQGFLSDETKLLHKERRNVVYMMNGAGLPKKLDDNIVSTLDIIPSIAKIVGVPIREYEGHPIELLSGQKRDFALTESIHPGQAYQVAISGEGFEYYFETLNNLNNNCKVDLTKFNSTINYQKEFLNEKISKEFLDNIILERAIPLQEY